MTVLLRFAFLALIALGLAGQAASRERDSGDDTGAMAALATRLAGLALSADDAARSDLVTARSPGCEVPVLATVLPIDGAEDRRLLDLQRPGRRVLYAYLGFVGERPSRTTLTGRFAWAILRFRTGLRTDRPSADMAAIALPLACPGLATLDWSSLSPGG